MAWQASDADDVSAYLVYRDGVLVGCTRHARFEDTSVQAASNYRYRVLAHTRSGQLSQPAEISLSIPDFPPRKPFAQNRIPGVIECENYDIGEVGQTFYEQNPGQWTPYLKKPAYRPGNPQIKPAGSAGNGFAIGWTACGEWVEFTLDDVNPGRYDIEFSYSSSAEAQHLGFLAVELDGKPLCEFHNIVSTGNWDSYKAVRVEGVNVPKGKLLRLTIRHPQQSAAGFDLDAIRFIPAK